MVVVQKVSENSFGINIKPNSSLIGSNRIIFILSIAFVCLGIASMFFAVG